MIGFVLSLIGTRAGKLGALALVVLAAWAVHERDKARAIRAAEAALVARFEASAGAAELAALKARLVAAEQANEALQARTDLAEAAAATFAQELEDFANETPVNADGVVDGDLWRRLRSK